MYEQAYTMVCEKLDQIKNKLHVRVVKNYSYKKINMMNYFIYIGKLKAL